MAKSPITARSRSFTLLELMVVVVIVGIVSAFVVPNYYKTIEREHEKEIAMNIKLLYKAQKRYHARTGFYYPKDDGTLVFTDDLNDELDVHIIENNTRYVCHWGDWCMAWMCGNSCAWGGKWAVKLRFSQDLDDICCWKDGGTCPTLPQCAF